MNDPNSLLSLPPRELDARLAECMEPKPIRTIWARQRSECGFWESWNREWYPAEFSAPSSPRSLLESVEAEIERRGLAARYWRALRDLLIHDDEVITADREFLITAAKAPIRAAAAVAVMEPK